MLETVKKTMADAPFISFGQYFIEYVFKVQDANIDNEVSFLLRNNSIDANFLDKLMNQEVKEGKYD